MPTYLARRRRRQQSVVAVWLTVLLFALISTPFVATVPRVLAASASYLDLSPEGATYRPGDTVTLHASVYDEDGNLLTGSPTNVRFFFSADSPNNPDDPGASSDMDCSTGSDGRCDVTYVASSLGTDTICARPSLMTSTIRAWTAVLPGLLRQAASERCAGSSAASSISFVRCDGSVVGAVDSSGSSDCF